MVLKMLLNRKDVSPPNFFHLVSFGTLLDKASIG